MLFPQRFLLFFQTVALRLVYEQKLIWRKLVQVLQTCDRRPFEVNRNKVKLNYITSKCGIFRTVGRCDWPKTCICNDSFWSLYFRHLLHRPRQPTDTVWESRPSGESSQPECRYLSLSNITIYISLVHREVAKREREFPDCKPVFIQDWGLVHLFGPSIFLWRRHLGTPFFLGPTLHLPVSFYLVVPPLSVKYGTY